MRKDIYERKEDIQKWINSQCSKSYICKELKCKPETLNRYLKLMNICYDGKKPFEDGRRGHPKYVPLIEYMKTSKDIQSNKIRVKLLNEGYKKQKCESCHLTEWLGKPIPLELHHIDGNHYHNEIQNFQLLCPNCHAMTDTYRGKNVNNHAGVSE